MSEKPISSYDALSPADNHVASLTRYMNQCRHGIKSFHQPTKSSLQNFLALQIYQTQNYLAIQMILRQLTKALTQRSETEITCSSTPIDFTFLRYILSPITGSSSVIQKPVDSSPLGLTISQFDVVALKNPEASIGRFTRENAVDSLDDLQ